MVIRVLDIVPGANTADQGLKVFDQLKPAMSSATEVAVSFNGIQTATSSFVNAAFVRLLYSLTLAEIKSRLRVIESTRQINDMIKRCLERAAANVAA